MNDAVANSGEGVFRWQALFQRTLDPLFVLDRRQRLVFANRAWESLAGQPLCELRGLVCRRPRPASAADTREDILAHALTPPPEASHGLSRIRRLLPGAVASRCWWDVEFFPLRLTAEGTKFLLGRVTLVPAHNAAPLALPERLANLRAKQAERHGFELLASELPAIQRLGAQVRLAARVTDPVLLIGEAGAGKRTLARIIHYQGPNRERAFAAVDCAHLPVSALTSVLFGEQTGAPLGTLYLAEPACLPRDLQLRLCQQLAGHTERQFPRFLAGSSTDPADDVSNGRLLEELRCRLSPLVLEVPSLRQRREDLAALALTLLARAGEGADHSVTDLSESAWEMLCAHSWPGNLRELYDTLAAACLHCQGEIIDAGDLPASLRLARRLEATHQPAVEPKIALDQVLEQAERRLIERALARAGGNKTRAAESLGIWRQRLIRRIEVLGIADVEGKKEDGEPEA